MTEIGYYLVLGIAFDLLLQYIAVKANVKPIPFNLHLIVVAFWPFFALYAAHQLIEGL